MIVRFGMKMPGSVGRTVLHGQRRLCASKFGVPKLIKNDEKCSFLGTQQACRAHSSSGSSASVEKSLLGHLKEQYLEASKIHPPPVSSRSLFRFRVYGRFIEPFDSFSALFLVRLCFRVEGGF
jgi:hypothetical protein